jgi:hypothetical protein
LDDHRDLRTSVDLVRGVIDTSDVMVGLACLAACGFLVTPSVGTFLAERRMRV